MLDFAAHETGVVRFFENTRSPDEGFFQTILANSSFAPAMRRNLTYSDWTAHGSHPATITAAHVERFAQPGPVMGRGVYGDGELCFARKFPDDGGEMTRLVDAVIAAHDRALGLLPAGHQLTGQLAMMLVMVGYTFTGLYLLFGG